MTETEMLDDIVEWLNKNYDQNSENYSIIDGPKSEVIRYNDDTAISFWGCGAIVCFKSILYFICEDDGNWFIHSENEYYNGMQSCFSIGWAKGFSDALLRLMKYVKKNGKPVYYSGTKKIAHYTL